MREPLYLRGDVWWCRVRNPEGGRAHKVSTGCRDRRAAVLAWRNLERQSFTASDTSEDTSPTLADALDARIKERKSAGRADGTLHMLGIKARQLTRVLGSETRLSRIGAAEVDTFVSTRLSEGASRATIYKELSTLRGALKLAARRDEYPHVVAAVMPLDFAIQYRPRERALSEHEIELLLAELPEERAAVVAFILATSATYPSELASLVASDVDVKAWTVRLRGTKAEGRYRTVPIVDFARPWIRRALPFVPFTPWTNVRRDLRDACSRLSTCAKCRAKGERAPVKDCASCRNTPTFAPVSPNDLRRTLATQLRARGVEPQLIAPVLGHADSRMVERVYGRIAPERLAHLLDGRLREHARTSPKRTKRPKRKGAPKGRNGPKGKVSGYSRGTVHHTTRRKSA